MPGSPEQLFTLFRTTGQPAPLGELFDRVSAQLLALALHLRGDPADAEDALQATFVTAMEQRAQWDESRPLLPWLCGILTNKCRQIGERRGRRREADLPELLIDEDSTPLAATERVELVARLRQHVAQLPNEQRQVLLLQLEHGLSIAEVAEVVAEAPGTVRMRLHRGLKALRGLMPAGLLATMLAALPSRGLAAVRLAVVRHAGGIGVAVASSGFVLTKKVGIAVVALALFALGWELAPPMWRTSPAAGPQSIPLLVGDLRTPTIPSTAEPATHGEERVVAPPTEPAATPAASARGTLIVRTLHTGTLEPVPNVPIRVLAAHGDVDDAFAGSTAVTGNDGTCVLPDCSEGRFVVRSLGGLTCEATVLPDRTTYVDLLMAADQAPIVTVRGRVVHRDNSPAAGATILVSVQGRQFAEAIGTAGSDGRFAIRIEHRFLLVGAREHGSAPTALQSFPADQEIEMVLPGPGATVAGLVVDANGTPVAAAEVEVRGDTDREQWVDARGVLMESPRPQRLTTQANGRFVAADLPAGPVSVSIRADGFAPFTKRATAGETADLRCELVAGVAVQGRVLDEEGKPVANAQIDLVGEGRQRRVADAEGRFGYRHLAFGPHQLEVSGRGITTCSCPRTADVATSWTLVVQREPRWLLRFVDESGNALPGWCVGWNGSDARNTFTDEQGRVELFGAAAGQAGLSLGPPTCLQAVLAVDWPVRLTPGVEATVVVATSMQPHAVLTGNVLGPDGTALSAGTIEVLGVDDNHLYRQALTAGAFRFEAMPAGTWVIEVHRASRGAAGGRFLIEALQAGEARDLGELRLPPEGSLQLRVLLADGGAPEDANVYLFDVDGREHNAPPRDGQPHAWPIGRYTWKVMAEPSLWQTGVIDVRRDEATALDIVLRPGVRRRLQFPVPSLDCGKATLAEYVLRAADGTEYDRGSFDPRSGMPHQCTRPLAVGTWALELQLDDGRRFVGDFGIESMTASLEPLRIAVQPQQ